MQDRSNDPLIDVSQLTVGMFIHLDLGWMSHPFPLSSFKIASSDQLLILRRLGLTQVRWSPAKSDLALQAVPDAAAVTAGESSAAAPVLPSAPSPEDLAREAHRRFGRQAVLVDDGVDLSAQSSTRTANGVIRAPFFPPAACWWARMMDESIICIDCGDRAARASKIVSQTPALAHRL